MEYFLIDNGSLRAGSVLQMREIAQNLSAQTGHSVRPFGLMHSHKVALSELRGVPGQSMQEFLGSDKAEEVNEIRALPFFLDPAWRLPIGCRKIYRHGKTANRKFANTVSLIRFFSPGTIGLPGRWQNYAGSKSNMPGLSIPRWRWWIMGPLYRKSTRCGRMWGCK